MESKTIESTAVVKKTEKKHTKRDLYMENVLTRSIELPFTKMGKNVKELLHKKLTTLLEGKCVIEGYIKNNSIRVINYSAGELTSSNVKFVVLFKCLVCNPTENQRITVRALNITKAGIRAEAVTGGESPLDVFIARDHNYKNKQFATIKDGDEFDIKVVGQRYEINDPVISVLGELPKPRIRKSKPRLVIKK